MAILLIIVVTFLTFVGITAARILFTLYALHLGASTGVVGSITAVMYIFPLLLSWPVGALSDRIGARWLLFAGIGCGAAGLVLPYFFQNLAALYIASASMGLTMVFINVTAQNTIGNLSKPHERTKNFANFTLNFSICNFVAPALAGVSIDHLGFPSTSLVIITPLVMSFVMLLIWGRVLPAIHERKHVQRGSLLHIMADRRLWNILSISSLSQMTVDVFQTFMPIYGQHIGLSASIIGGILSAIAVGSFAVRVVMQRLIKSLGEYRLLIISFLSGAAALVLVPFMHGAVALSVLALIFGIFQGASQPVIMVLMYNQAEEGRAGEAIGLRMTLNNLVRIVSPMAFGAVGTIAGVNVVFWANGVLLSAGAKLSQTYLQKVKAARSKGQGIQI